MEHHLEHSIQHREKRLQHLKEMDKSTMEQMLQDLREEHPYLVSMEAHRVDGAEQGYYQQLLEQNEDQSLLVQKEIDTRYQKQIKTVTPKAPLLGINLCVWSADYQCRDVAVRAGFQRGIALCQHHHCYHHSYSDWHWCLR